MVSKFISYSQIILVIFDPLPPILSHKGSMTDSVRSHETLRRGKLKMRVTKIMVSVLLGHNLISWGIPLKWNILLSTTFSEMEEETISRNSAAEFRVVYTRVVQPDLDAIGKQGFLHFFTRFVMLLSTFWICDIFPTICLQAALPWCFEKNYSKAKVTYIWVEESRPSQFQWPPALSLQRDDIPLYIFIF